MTARDIQRALIVERYSRSFVLPNYTPKGWWECDVFEITKAGYFVEWEIKLSRSDFLADQKKRRMGWRYREDLKRGEMCELGAKHAKLKEADQAGPSRFWFVLPVGIVTLSEVPDFAGVMRAIRFSRDHAPPFRVRFEIERDAPRLHGLKCDQTVRDHAEGVCYWRFTRMFCWGVEAADSGQHSPSRAPAGEASGASEPSDPVQSPAEACPDGTARVIHPTTGQT